MIVKNRAGQEIRIICVDAPGARPIVGVFDEGHIYDFFRNGRHSILGASDDDLIDFHPENFGKPEWPADAEPWATVMKKDADGRIWQYSEDPKLRETDWGVHESRVSTVYIGLNQDWKTWEIRRPAPQESSIEQQIEAIKASAIAEIEALVKRTSK